MTNFVYAMRDSVKKTIINGNISIITQFVCRADESQIAQTVNQNPIQHLVFWPFIMFAPFLSLIKRIIVS